MTEPDRSAAAAANTGRGRQAAWLALPVVIAALVGLARWTSSETEPTALDLTSSGPSYATVEEMAGASDLVVIATIVAAEQGRSIGDPTNPDAGITTTLYRLDVEQLLAGQASRGIIVEHESALADGTPISINGTSAPTVGHRVLLFLIAGQSEAFPHHAIINEQGRYEIGGQRIVAATSHSLASEVEGTSLDDLVRSLAAIDPLRSDPDQARTP